MAVATLFVFYFYSKESSPENRTSTVSCQTLKPSTPKKEERLGGERSDQMFSLVLVYIMLCL
jgi:hypothetical protein